MNTVGFTFESCRESGAVGAVEVLSSKASLGPPPQKKATGGCDGTYHMTDLIALPFFFVPTVFP